MEKSSGYSLMGDQVFPELKPNHLGKPTPIPDNTNGNTKLYQFSKLSQRIPWPKIVIRSQALK